MEEATDRVTAAIETLFRLEGSRRIHRQQTDAAGVAVTPQGLRLLGRLIDVEPASPGQLAVLMQLDPAVVARLLRQLEDGGLVVRRRSTDDGRVATLATTAEGRAAFQRVREVIWRQMRNVLGGWADDEVSTLAGLLDKLVADVQKVPYEPLDEAGVSRL